MTMMHSTHTRDDERPRRGSRLVTEFWADVRHAARWLRRSPGFAVAAIVSLALGIGANAAIFSLIHTVVLRPLPVERPDELVVLSLGKPGQPPVRQLSYNLLQAIRQQAGEALDVAGSAPLRVSVEFEGRAYAAAGGRMVSGNYFPMLGVGATEGRTLVPADDTADAPAAAVLGYSYWQRQFGSDPSVVGKTVRLNGELFTIVGVSAPGFFGTHVGQMVDVTVPLATQPRINVDRGGSLVSGPGAEDLSLEVIGRVQPGVSPAQAQQRADLVVQQMLPGMIQRIGPKGAGFFKGRVAVLEPGSGGVSEFRQRASRPLMILMSMVAVVLLVACANVANLLLARAASRRTEIALRASLGAGRWRLIRQMLAESLVLALVGGACGLLLAMISSSALATLVLGAEAAALDLAPNATVLGFLLAVSVAAGLLFGVVPAFGATRVDTYGHLKDGARHVESRGSRFGMRTSLVVAQVALSVVLLVGAGLFVRTLMNLQQLDLGFEREQVLALRLEPRGSNQKTANESILRQMYGSLLTRLEGVPGVRGVSLSGSTPLGDENAMTARLALPGYVPAEGEDTRVRMMQIYPNYFSILDVPLLAGRHLGVADDNAGAPRVAVVNEAMARRFFGSADAAIGRQFNTNPTQSFEIVGVVGNVRDQAPREPAGPAVYASYAHTPTGRGQMTLLVRTVGDPRLVVPSIRRFAREMDPTMPLLAVETLEERVDAATRQDRLVAVLASLFGGLAVLLAAVGLSGLLSYTIARRRKEFSLRLALGESPRGLRHRVLKDSLVLVVIGLAVGLVASIMSVDRISQLLFGIEPMDPLVFVATAVLLLACALIAAYLPARRVGRLDPVAVLRGD